MAITFSASKENNYFVSTWVGLISDSEMLCSYREFLDGKDYVPGMHELADLSRVNFKSISSTALNDLALLMKTTLENNAVVEMKTAAYSATDLQYGLARIYETWSSESPESVQVFRDKVEALHWLSGES